MIEKLARLTAFIVSVCIFDCFLFNKSKLNVKNVFVHLISLTNIETNMSEIIEKDLTNCKDSGHYTNLNSKKEGLNLEKVEQLTGGNNGRLVNSRPRFSAIDKTDT